MDRGAWWVPVHGVEKSRTRLSDQHVHFHFLVFLVNSMDRGAWYAAVHGITRVRHDLATKQQQ